MENYTMQPVTNLETKQRFIINFVFLSLICSTFSFQIFIRASTDIENHVIGKFI